MTQPTNQNPVPKAAKLTDALLTCADWDDPVDVAYKVSEAASQYTYDYCRQPLPAKIQARIAELEAHVQEVDDDGDDFPYVKGNAIGMLNGFRECAELVAHSAKYTVLVKGLIDAVEEILQTPEPWPNNEAVLEWDRVKADALSALQANKEIEDGN